MRMNDIMNSYIVKKNTSWFRHNDHLHDVHCTEVRMIITNIIGFQHDDFLHDVPGMVKTW